MILKTERNKMRSISGIVAFVFIFLIIFYIVYFVKRRRMKKRRQAEEIEKRNMKNIEEATDEVASLKIDYIDKDEFVKMVQEEVHQGEKPKGPSRKIEFKF